MKKSIRLSDENEARLVELMDYKQNTFNRLSERNNSTSDAVALAIELTHQLFVQPFKKNDQNGYEKMLKRYLTDSKSSDDPTLKILKNMSKEQEKEYIAILNIFKFMIGDENGAWLAQMDHFDDAKGITVLIDKQIKKLISNDIKSTLAEQNNKF
ncbi:MAG: hypothetical protein LBT37_06145 [Lactobacillaceae bacterium]|jgi:hypothetical protein|nr:hypothetical protein [Lactobacillaceae bacterium]